MCPLKPRLWHDPMFLELAQLSPSGSYIGQNAALSISPGHSRNMEQFILKGKLVSGLTGDRGEAEGSRQHYSGCLSAGFCADYAHVAFRIPNIDNII